jgi:hypothetical protein
MRLVEVDKHLINGSGPTKRKPNAKNEFPIIDAAVGYLILSQT